MIVEIETIKPTEEVSNPGDDPEKDLIYKNCPICSIDMTEFCQSRRVKHMVKCFRNGNKRHDMRCKKVKVCKHRATHIIPVTDDYHERVCFYNPSNLKQALQFSNGSRKTPDAATPIPNLLHKGKKKANFNVWDQGSIDFKKISSHLELFSCVHPIGRLKDKIGT